MGAHRTLLVTLVAASLAAAILFATGVGGWPGEGNGCRLLARPACFCETPRAGLVAQPANTVSNLGFVLVGLMIAATADRDARRRTRGERPEPANPLTRTRLHPGLHAVVVALLGPGSMALHASLTRWGGQLDVTSMYLYSGLLTAYAWKRLAALGAVAFLALFVGSVALLVWSKLATAVSSDLVFGSSLAAAALSEAAVRLRRPRAKARLGFAALALGLFGLAFAIWLPSRSGGALCDPASWLQGHAVWHLLCAAAAGAMYCYLRSEAPAPLSSGREAV